MPIVVRRRPRRRRRVDEDRLPDGTLSVAEQVELACELAEIEGAGDAIVVLGPDAARGRALRIGGRKGAAGKHAAPDGVKERRDRCLVWALEAEKYRKKHPAATERQVARDVERLLRNGKYSASAETIRRRLRSLRKAPRVQP